MAELTLPVILQMVQTIGILVGVFGYLSYFMSEKSHEIYLKKREIQDAFNHYTKLLEDNAYFSKRKLNRWNNKCARAYGERD